MASLRKYLDTCGQTRYAVSQATGIPQSVLSRFVMNGQPLRGVNADILAEYLGLELKPIKGGLVDKAAKAAKKT
jgi:sugar (pentulose or hexulose) kinase